MTMPLLDDAALIMSPEQWEKARHQPLADGERKLLIALAEGEKAQNDDYDLSSIVWNKGGGWWHGTRRLSAKVCKSLTYRAYVRTDDRYDADYQTWTINEDGRKAIGRAA